MKSLERKRGWFGRILR